MSTHFLSPFICKNTQLMPFCFFYLQFKYERFDKKNEFFFSLLLLNETVLRLHLPVCIKENPFLTKKETFWLGSPSSRFPYPVCLGSSPELSARAGGRKYPPSRPRKTVRYCRIIFCKTGKGK